MSGEIFSGSIETRDFIKLHSQNSPLPCGEFPLHLMERVRVRWGEGVVDTNPLLR
jgi:hypothetical protein